MNKYEKLLKIRRLNSSVFVYVKISWLYWSSEFNGKVRLVAPIIEKKCGEVDPTVRVFSNRSGEEGREVFVSLSEVFVSP